MSDLIHSRTLADCLLAAGILLAIAGSASADMHYVDVNGTNATPPYTNWTTAATNIQDAVDAAVAGDEVVVTNGIYATGGREVDCPSRVVIDKALTVRSVNGPQFTAIHGSQPGPRHSNPGFRCVWLTGGASLSGFRLTNGYALTFTPCLGGGGVFCSWSSAVVSNCVIAGNQAVDPGYGIHGPAHGGGAIGGTLNSCTLTGNSASGNFSDAYGGGAYGCTLNNCTLTGNWEVGAYSSTLNNSTLSGNGVGAFDCTLSNCLLAGNGAAASKSGLNNCTLTGNGTGAIGCGLANCIAYFNDDNYIPYDSSPSTLSCCCTMPLPTNGVGNITNAPLFVDTNGWANLHLQSNSPCINAGNNAYAVGDTDLDGNPRIAGGTVDIGAYEFQSPASMISYAWLQQFNLPINPATDSADPDGDGVDNYHEWLAGTDPTDPFSSPAQLTIIPSGTNVILIWPTHAVGFKLQSSTNLVSPAWSTNHPAPVVIGGQNVIINPFFGPQQFYRLKQ